MIPIDTSGFKVMLELKPWYEWTIFTISNLRSAYFQHTNISIDYFVYLLVVFSYLQCTKIYIICKMAEKCNFFFNYTKFCEKM